MSWEGKALERGLVTLGQREGRNHDITARKDFKHGFPILSEKVTLVSTGGTGVDNSWANAAGATILVLDVFLDITTPATGAATADVGIGATSTTTDDTIMDGVDVGTAAIFASGGNNAGINGGVNRKMTSSQFVTVDWKADAAGLVGTMTVLYVVLG